MYIGMRYLGLLGLILGTLFLSGCIVSATHVVVQKFSPDPKVDFYFYQIDLATEKEWRDHFYEINDIQALGFEFYIYNYTSGNIEFSLYADEYSGRYSDPSSISTTAFVVLNDIIVMPGENKFPYSRMIRLQDNTDRLRDLAKTGLFDIYTTSTEQVGSSVIIDSVKLFVTFSAG